jgi:hypothetical protein
MKTQEELQAFYDSTLKPQIKELELKRQRAVTGSIIAIMVLTIVGLFVGLMIVSSGGPVFLLFPLIVAVIIGGVVFRLATSGYRNDFKHTIIRSIIEFLEPGLRYNPDFGISKELFRAGDMFRHKIDRYHSEDMVQGKVGQTDIAFSEVHAEYKTGSGKDTHWHTIFKGLVFIGDFHKDFRGRMVVLPDTAEKLFGGLGQKLQGWNLSRNSLIKMDDPEFEREFVVYGTDQVESRYILSPSLMERICAFRKKIGTQLFLGFAGSRVFVAIPKKEDWFEPVFFGATGFDKVLAYAAQLRFAAGIVEELNLNTRIWSKV